MELPNAANITRRIESFLLNNATLMPNSMSILDSGGRLVAAAVENIPDVRILASYDWNYQIESTGILSLSPAFFRDRKKSDIIAMPVCGPGFPNYGHFLYDGLPAALMHRHLLRDDISIVGQPLRDWQKQILDVLDLLSSYVSIEHPTQFRKVLGTTMLSMHLPYPSRFARVVFDQIRFRLGVGERRPQTRVFLSRATDLNKRVLINREEVDDLMVRLGFEVVCPDKLSFREQVFLMASARVVVGEAGAGMANIGFCDPGAIVLEILPMADGWTRGACFLMSHRWHGFFPAVTTTFEGGVAEAARTGHTLSYSIDCDELATAIENVIGTLPVVGT